MRYHLPHAVSMLVLVLPLSGAAGGQAPDPRRTPYAATPGLAALMDWVTFHLSFDGGSFVPDMAAGESAPQVHGEPEFAPGVLGQALVAGTGAAIYARAGNFAAQRQGAASLWICPVAWDHRSDGNTPFVMTSNASFYVQRQGPLYAQDGTVQRFEVLQFLLLSPTTGNVYLQHECNRWASGEWHLLVANWRWPRMEFSLDGGAFAAAAAPRLPTDATFGDILVGSEGGPRTLLDEVFLYRRPLTEGEAHLLWETLRPR